MYCVCDFFLDTNLHLMCYNVNQIALRWVRTFSLIHNKLRQPLIGVTKIHMYWARDQLSENC